MTIAEFKKIARLLKAVYKELEEEAIKQGMNLLSPEYQELVDKARMAVLEKNGFTLEEYRDIKEQVSGIDKEGTLAVMQDTQKKLEELDNRHIPTDEEIEEIAERVAKKYIVPPTITNQIVKERIIEQPKIIETTREVIKKEKYDDKALKEELASIKKRVESIKEPDLNKFREEVTNAFQKYFQDNINTLEMPDFRKLGMGLQQQIDQMFINFEQITVSSTAPSNPHLNDLWYDIS